MSARRRRAVRRQAYIDAARLLGFHFPFVDGPRCQGKRGYFVRHDTMFVGLPRVYPQLWRAAVAALEYIDFDVSALDEAGEEGARGRFSRAPYRG